MNSDPTQPQYQSETDKIWEEVARWETAVPKSSSNDDDDNDKNDVRGSGRAPHDKLAFVSKVEAQFSKTAFDMFDFIWAKFNQAHRSQLKAITPKLAETWLHIAKEFQHKEFGKHVVSLLRGIVHAVDTLYALQEHAVTLSSEFLKTITAEEAYLDNEEKFDAVVAAKRAEIAKSGGNEKLMAFDSFISSFRDAFDKVDAVAIHFHAMAPRIAAVVAAKAISQFVRKVMEQAALINTAALAIGSMEFYAAQQNEIDLHDQDRIERFEKKLEELEKAVTSKESAARHVRDELALHMLRTGRLLAVKWLEYNDGDCAEEEEESESGDDGSGSRSEQENEEAEE